MSKGNGGAARPNKYPGACDRCGGRVPTGEGLLMLKRKGKWPVRHVTCNHEGARQVGPPIMSTGHNVAQVAVTSPACGLTGVQLHPGEGRLEGRNLSRRIAAQDSRRRAEDGRVQVEMTDPLGGGSDYPDEVDFLDAAADLDARRREALADEEQHQLSLSSQFVAGL